MSDVEWQICLISVGLAIVIVSCGLLLVSIAICLGDHVLAWRRRKKDKVEAARREIQSRARRAKEREARRYAEDDDFSRKMWEMLSNEH